jgi:hypothetical protein
MRFFQLSMQGLDLGLDSKVKKGCGLEIELSLHMNTLLRG